MIGNVNIIWKVNRDDEKMIIQKCQKQYQQLIISYQKTTLIKKYQKVYKISSTVLNNMCQELTGDNSKALNKLEEKQREPLAEILASHEEQNSVHDMKYFNGKKGHIL